LRLEKTLGRLLPSSRDPGAHVLALTFLHELAGPTARASAPPSARWSDLREQPDRRLGAMLDDACHVCQATWPDVLDGFFDGVDFTSSPAREIRQGIQALERLEDRMGPWQRETRLGDIYQLTRSLSAKQWQGAFFTPFNLARAMATINEPRPGEFVGDISGCGAGVFLIAALGAVRERHGDRLAKTITLLGVDLDPRTCQIARASLLLAGADPNQFYIACGDSLARPLVGRDRADGELKVLTPTCLLGNPPFGMSVRISDLEREAARGPLIVPDRVLYRPLLLAAHEADELVDNGPRPIQRASADADGRLFTDYGLAEAA